MRLEPPTTDTTEIGGPVGTVVSGVDTSGAGSVVAEPSVLSVPSVPSVSVVLPVLSGSEAEVSVSDTGCCSPAAAATVVAGGTVASVAVGDVTAVVSTGSAGPISAAFGLVESMTLVGSAAAVLSPVTSVVERPRASGTDVVAAERWEPLRVFDEAPSAAAAASVPLEEPAARNPM